jgi:hypothetical protein
MVATFPAYRSSKRSRSWIVVLLLSLMLVLRILASCDAENDLAPCSCTAGNCFNCERGADDGYDQTGAADDYYAQFRNLLAR